MRHGLSKSKILSGLQCPKRLYLEVHRPQLATVEQADQFRMDMGEEVNRVARGLYPDGAMIESAEDLRGALQATREHLGRHPGRPCFEATFEHDGVLVRVDILRPTAPGSYAIVEVKSASRLKDYYLPDCAVQAWVLEGAGVPLERVELAHIDTGFVYPGGGDYRGVLRHEDLTEPVAATKQAVADWVSQFRAVLAGPEPEVEPGPQCTDPFDCPFQGYCWPPGPEYPLSILPHAREGLLNELAAEGYTDVRQIPEGRLARPRHQRVQRVTASGRAEIDPELIDLLRALPFPRRYIDFETLNPAIPQWAGTHPYEAVPFQWSCHTELASGEILHHGYLETEGKDPRIPFAQSLLRAVAADGPVLIYSPYERRILSALGVAFPDLAPALHALIERTFDLLPALRAHYYHPAMKGSWSIKAVLPTLAPELSYADLGEVQDGQAAQMAYWGLLQPDTVPARRTEIIDALRRYCALDTLAMVRVVRALLSRGPADALSSPGKARPA